MANFNFNKVIIGGRMCSTPELKHTQNSVPVVAFTVAVNRKHGEQTTDFFNIVAWRSNAEFISKYFSKGSSICIEGTLQTRKYTDQNGIERQVTEIVADNAYFVDSKSDNRTQQPAYVPEAYTTPDAPNFEEITEDDDLPF